MKTMIVYSSRTGNTETIARAIHQEMPRAELFPVEEAPSPEGFDLLVLGFWVDKGTADVAAREYLQRVGTTPTALFATLGAYPDSNHARESMERASEFLSGAPLVGSFVCQGAVDSKLQNWMESLPPDHPHGPTEERLKRWRDASTHPDGKDCEAARVWARGLIREERS
ncbi:Flavodoxin domain-containing protein [Alkalispirochaeta americana]|uniref:Flavodoxin domain-containing protein n=1 Tax=Alkalispirochaeta americana TaxID=159291 RepID=A0A1N6Q654_9SPIO|nr:flavodoxin family protein [Alkalispirochaeta americana]SIQ12050.1 Flavodoxin domain-containing protein [Alkalispirochaeta americana]